MATVTFGPRRSADAIPQSSTGFASATSGAKTAGDHFPGDGVSGKITQNDDPVILLRQRAERPACELDRGDEVRRTIGRGELVEGAYRGGDIGRGGQGYVSAGRPASTSATGVPLARRAEHAAGRRPSHRIPQRTAPFTVARMLSESSSTTARATDAPDVRASDSRSQRTSGVAPRMARPRIINERSTSSG